MKYLKLFRWSWDMNKKEPFSVFQKIGIGLYVVRQQYKWNKVVTELKSKYSGEELETATFAVSRGFSYKGISL